MAHVLDRPASRAANRFPPAGTPHRRSRPALFRLLTLAAVVALLAVMATLRSRHAQPQRFGDGGMIVWDPAALANARARIASGDTALSPALARLRTEADKVLGGPAPSVMDNAQVPTGGSPHDYVSWAVYYWPAPGAPGGAWVRRDGEVNPSAVAAGDAAALRQMARGTSTLTLAWYLTGDTRYAAGAAQRLRTWFLEPTTAMNPSFEFAQSIRGQAGPNPAGLIEAREFIRVLDAAELLAGTSVWTAGDSDALRAWFRKWDSWLQTSPTGQSERRAANNHGSWEAAGEARVALFLGDRARAAEIVTSRGRQLIASQVETGGAQPLELVRTRPFHYSVFNLQALFTLAEVGRSAGVDLWSWVSPDGRSLQAAFGFLEPYLGGARPWPGPPSPVPSDAVGGADLLQRANRAWPGDVRLADRARSVTPRQDRWRLLTASGP